MAKLTFSISKGILSYSSTAFSMSIKATSGNGDCMNSASSSCTSVAWKGAIPLGKYTIFASEISKPSALHTAVRNIRGDWGDWRVPIHPNKGTQVWSRDGFFLHGGMFEGSAGCIDFGGGIFGNESTDLLKTAIELSGVIELVVIK